ncbi:peptidase [Flavobacterium sp. I-SCBP12n]|uniref:Peptidase n=2 Tax=Flavobacterium TaxID=237 RepID=A0A9X2BJJ1_9FLAO|nr:MULTISPECIES: peptidase [Flavobacterium]MBP4141188.1 peptidase [Flavobacterium flabelliforme]MCK8140499.1 peptidase [Flavobacterium pygoscelis]
MPKKKLKRRKIKENLFNKRRLIILNEDTFEETFSFKLTLMNVFIFATLGAVIIITVTTFIIAFTPLREFIPGYSSSKLKKDATELALKSDSLTTALKKNEAYILSIKKVLTGQLEYAKFNKDSILASTDELVEPELLKASKEELELRKEVSEEEKTSLLTKKPVSKKEKNKK